MSREISFCLYFLIVFAANILGAIGGFGAGMISIPFLTSFLNTKNVVMASTITCILNVLIAIKNWRDVDWKHLGRIAFFLCLGLPLGISVMKFLPVLQLKLLLGIFMLFTGLYGLLKFFYAPLEKKHMKKGALNIILFLGGLAQGAFSSGGSFVLLYAQQEITDKARFRATMALLWTGVSVFAVLQYLVAGTLTTEALQLSAVGVPAVLLGLFVGGKVYRHLSQRAFLLVIYLLITVAGGLNCALVLLS